MLAIEVGHLAEGDEELGAVRVGARVGHRQLVRLRVLQIEVLIVKLVAVDGLSTSAVTLGEVATLSHEAGDDSVELAALVAQRDASRGVTSGTCSELGEVVGSQRHSVAIEAENDAASILTIDFQIEEDLSGDGVGSRVVRFSRCIDACILIRLAILNETIQVIHDLLRTTTSSSVVGIAVSLVMANSTVVLIKMTTVVWVSVVVRDGWDLRGSIIVPLCCIASVTVRTRVASCSIIAVLRSEVAIVLRRWLEVTIIYVGWLEITVVDRRWLVISVVDR